MITGVYDACPPEAALLGNKSVIKIAAMFFVGDSEIEISTVGIYLCEQIVEYQCEHSVGSPLRSAGYILGMYALTAVINAYPPCHTIPEICGEETYLIGKTLVKEAKLSGSVDRSCVVALRQT